MAQLQKQIQCPNCKSPIQAPIQQLIDVTQNPSAKARLLSGSLNRIVCPVCGFEGQISTMLVYHDATHELLLTYTPIELNIPKDEQERIVGRLINQAVNALPPEERKGYLFQPQSMLTMQSLIEHILEADGISREEIEAQRAKMRLFEDLLRIPEEKLNTFITEHDDELDATFFQLASITLQATNDPQAREAINIRLGKALEFSSYGQELTEQEAELQAAVESLNEIGKELKRQDILDLVIKAPNEKRVVAIVNLTRPALDYSFFQMLTEHIETTEGDEQVRLTVLRARILEVTEQIDKVQEARTAQATSLLESLLKAENLDQALKDVLPLVDDLFFGILQINLKAAQERGDQRVTSMLEMINESLHELILKSLPPGIQMAQKILETEDEAQAFSMLEASPDQIDDQFLGVLITTAERFEDANENADAERILRLYRHALRISMSNKVCRGASKH